MNYTKIAANVIKTLRKNGATGTLTKTDENLVQVVATCKAVRIERRIGDKRMYDESVEIGDYKYICDNTLVFEEGDMFTFAGGTRVVSRVEEFKPADVKIFTYVWTRSA